MKEPQQAELASTGDWELVFDVLPELVGHLQDYCRSFDP